MLCKKLGSILLLILLLFQTEIMKTEFERLQARLPMDMLSMKRYNPFFNFFLYNFYNNI